MRERKTNL